MFEISLILPTRKRTGQLRRALESLVRTAENPERIEVVLYIDRDDYESQQFEFPAVRIVRVVGARTSMGRMTQACYDRTSGRTIMLANDDMEFRTPGWDRLIRDAINVYEDGVALVWGNDLETGAPAHPFLSRQLCELMGGICPESYDRILIDTHLYDVFRKLQYAGVERFCYLPDVIIEHLCPSAGKATVDETYQKFRCGDDERTYILWDDERQLLAMRLVRHIEEYAANCRRSNLGSMVDAA